MEIEAQKAVRRIKDHRELVKQYQNVVRAYNNFITDYPCLPEGLMQDNCWFGDMMMDEKRKIKFKYKLGRLMGEYAVPLHLVNFNLNNKQTRRLVLWKNCRGVGLDGVWFDHVLSMVKRKMKNV